jgi:hypothetical protein
MEGNTTMTKIKYEGSDKYWITQTPTVVSQAAAVQNTWYPLLAATACRVIKCVVTIDTANETLETRIIVDGITINPIPVACIALQNNKAFLTLSALAGVIQVQLQPNSIGSYDDTQYLIEGRSVAIDMRKTTANGAGTLKGAVHLAIKG